VNMVVNVVNAQNACQKSDVCMAGHRLLGARIVPRGLFGIPGLVESLESSIPQTSGSFDSSIPHSYLRSWPVFTLPLLQ